MKTYFTRFWPMYLVVMIAFSIIAVSGSRAVTTIADSIPVDRSITFVIDAGHGGDDPGAIGNNVYETDQSSRKP